MHSTVQIKIRKKALHDLSYSIQYLKYYLYSNSTSAEHFEFTKSNVFVLVVGYYILNNMRLKSTYGFPRLNLKIDYTVEAV